MQHLDRTIYPSTHPSVAVAHDNDQYGGAHTYILENCLGFANGDTQYGGGVQVIQFCHKADDGHVTPGVLDQQLAIVMLDRIEKLNARFPCEENAQMIAALESFLEASRLRVENRMKRGVMGELKK